jgi:hypothetical protein
MTASFDISSPGGEPAITETPETRDENLYQATMQLLYAPPRPPSAARAIAILIGSLALFALASIWFGWSLDLLLTIIGVLLFHELGHFIGMRIFGYRDVQMFFIPFFGAAVTGVKYGVPVWQQATVLLLGPLPGLLLALVLQWTLAPEWAFAPAPFTAVEQAIFWLTFVNAFNLLPIKPMDGGRIVDLLFFARSPNLAAAFHFLAGLALAALALFASSVVLALLCLLVLLTVRATHRQAKEALWIRSQGLKFPDEIERLDEAQRRHVFALALASGRASAGGQVPPAILAIRFRRLYGYAVARSPTIATIILFMGLYMVGFACSTLVSWQVVSKL